MFSLIYSCWFRLGIVDLVGIIRWLSRLLCINIFLCEFVALLNNIIPIAFLFEKCIVSMQKSDTFCITR